MPDAGSGTAATSRARQSSCGTVVAALLLLFGCSTSGSDDADGADFRQSAFRIRTDLHAALNAADGWAGAMNEAVVVNADQPFRIRFELERPTGADGTGPLRLLYRWR
jgi:hypothetical protein